MTWYPRRAAAVLFALPVLLAAACSAPAAAPPAPSGPSVQGCVPGAQAPAGDVAFSHATNVRITGADGYRVLTVAQPFPGGRPQSVVLVGCGDPAPVLPAALAQAPVVRTPVSGVFAASTTQLPMLTELGALDRITGVGGLALVTDPAVRGRVTSGAATEFAPNGTLDAEAVVAAAPPVVLSAGTDDAALPALSAAGIPVVGWADYLENGPLGQAEWIKVVGALTGQDARAAEIFAGIATRYDDLAGRVRGLAPVPAVAGQPYQGTWNVPAAGSTAGILLRDAGATWLGAAVPGTGTQERSLEQVLAQDGDAPVWLADGPFATTADVAALDPRLTALAAVRSGGLWTRDRATTPEGGNALYERGALHQDEILADLVAILHPQVLPGHVFTYYRQVPTG
ncbi:ABC transporter substrate-binding protein [Pseudonocardia spirodelae]|uniref:ABC transporter substrate-binding protein n=1 Tax=Pseudonocardia spirodelae TaxID=3133431 RepID=A0ABU8T0U7_9PSEU